MDLVKYLIEEMDMEVDYADTKEIYYSGNTALHEASINDHIGVVRYLIDKGANLHREGKRRDGFTPLHYAASYGNLRIAKLLVDEGADVNAVVQSKAAKREGITPLHLAVEDDNHFPMVDFLIANGADIDKPDSHNYTPLAFAEGKHNYTRGSSYEPKGECYGSIGRRIINRCKRDGSMWEHIYAKGIEQGKFAHIAIKKMRINDVKLLIAMGVDVNVNISNAHTPLQGVVYYNHMFSSSGEPMSEEQKIASTEMAQILIGDGGADVNLTLSHYPPLHQAIKMRNVYMVEMLLANRADPTLIVNEWENQPMDAYQLAKEEYKGSKGNHGVERRILELLESHRKNQLFLPHLQHEGQGKQAK